VFAGLIDDFRRAFPSHENHRSTIGYLCDQPARITSSISAAVRVPCSSSASAPDGCDREPKIMDGLHVQLCVSLPLPSYLLSSLLAPRHPRVACFYCSRSASLGALQSSSASRAPPARPLLDLEPVLTGQERSIERCPRSRVCTLACGYWRRRRPSVG
jgi:hypothetical protein